MVGRALGVNPLCRSYCGPALANALADERVVVREKILHLVFAPPLIAFIVLPDLARVMRFGGFVFEKVAPRGSTRVQRRLTAVPLGRRTVRNNLQAPVAVGPRGLLWSLSLDPNHKKLRAKRGCGDFLHAAFWPR